MAVTHEQSVGAEDTDASVVATFASDVAVGNLIVITGAQWADVDNSAFLAADVTKTAGTSTIDTIQVDKQIDFEAGTNIWMRSGTWSCLVTGAGSLTITLDDGSFLNDSHISLSEYSTDVSWTDTRVEDTASASDAAPSASGSLATPTVTSNDAALFICAGSIQGTIVSSITKDTNFTLIDSGIGSSVSGAVGQYRIVTSGTSDAPDFSWTSAFAEGACVVSVVYKETDLSYLPFFPRRKNVLLRM